MGVRERLAERDGWLKRRSDAVEISSESERGGEFDGMRDAEESSDGAGVMSASYGGSCALLASIASFLKVGLRG